MDYVVGDNLSLIVPAVNPENPQEVLFDTGTEVTIESASNTTVSLKFPDGNIYSHDVKDLMLLFKKNSKKSLTVNHAGIGTPPKEVFGLLPSGSDWKKNYVWKIYISLEEKEDKSVICQNCTTEILDFNKKNATGDIYCPGCKSYSILFDLKNNKPFVQISEES